MKKIRIMFGILTVVWAIAVFCFSSQIAETSKNTSSNITKKIVKIINKDNLSEEEIQQKIQNLDPIIRKLAHYTLYSFGGFLIFATICTFNISTKRRILITQIIGSIYAITDELHQYFVPRTRMSNTRCNYRLTWSIYWLNIIIDFN